MVVSAAFEKHQQYFDKKNIALSKYCNIALFFHRNIACESRSLTRALGLYGTVSQKNYNGEGRGKPKCHVALKKLKITAFWYFCLFKTLFFLKTKRVRRK
jgi:hypothetical protein